MTTLLGMYAARRYFPQRRTPWDFENTPADKYPLLLFYHPLTIYRHQVIKQADRRLGHAVCSDMHFHRSPRNATSTFTIALTTGDSSLSACIQSIMAAEIGDLEKAIDYARAAVAHGPG